MWRISAPATQWHHQGKTDGCEVNQNGRHGAQIWQGWEMLGQLVKVNRQPQCRSLSRRYPALSPRPDAKRHHVCLSSLDKNWYHSSGTWESCSTLCFRLVPEWTKSTNFYLHFIFSLCAFTVLRANLYNKLVSFQTPGFSLIFFAFWGVKDFTLYFLLSS